MKLKNLLLTILDFAQIVGSVSIALPALTMARAYQEAHVLDSLKDGMKSLKLEVAALSLARTKQEERIKKLQEANDALEKRNHALEIRQKAE